MIKLLNRIFGNKEESQSTLTSSDIDLAIIVILLRAAAIDGDKDKIELDAIKEIALNSLNIKYQDFKDLYQKALEEEDFSADLYKWTKIINDNYDEKAKLNIYRLACKIINIDGKIDPFESNFTRRLSGLLYLTDKQAGEIRKEFSS
ncbi:MAG: TerB family tellurite resistance protein [Pseudomonadota bacterium]|nr:TerB family tellurite resistance protein [Pseudomonadota bacterium]MEC9382447.1 TerB family tellurite resistance protein [Pseudomonadota bacterium]